MGRTCNNICERHKAAPAPNRIRYQIGQKDVHSAEFLYYQRTPDVCVVKQYLEQNRDLGKPNEDLGHSCR
jgi:hypothetical protein